MRGRLCRRDGRSVVAPQHVSAGCREGTALIGWSLRPSHSVPEPGPFTSPATAIAAVNST